MCSAWRSCLPVYFDLSPRGITCLLSWVRAARKRRSGPCGSVAVGTPAPTGTCRASCRSGQCNIDHGSTH
jgi:hypothetical protein